MPTRIATAALIALFVINLVLLTLNLAGPSFAAVGGLNARRLENDADFVRAVHAVVERCRVNVDTARLQC
jgi:hypothetical protein